MLKHVGIGDLFAGWSVAWISLLGLVAFIRTTDGGWKNVVTAITQASGFALFLAALMTAATYLVVRLA